MEGHTVNDLTVRAREEERFVVFSLVTGHSDTQLAVQEGRVDGPSDGYVNGYKHKGTYGTGMARTR